MTLRSLLIVLALTGTVVAGYYADTLWQSAAEQPPAAATRPATPEAGALLRELADDGALDPRILHALEQLHATQQQLVREQRELRAELAELSAGAELVITARREERRAQHQRDKLTCDRYVFHLYFL